MPIESRPPLPPLLFITYAARAYAEAEAKARWLWLKPLRAWGAVFAPAGTRPFKLGLGSRTQGDGSPFLSN
jgi:hypothetical protein